MLSIYTNLTNRLALMRMQQEDGAVAIEYALLASLIAIAIIVSAGLLGEKIDSSFDFIRGKIKDA